ncbi:hypothetical protein SUGI_0621980 [Cryptomeria japonica]|uniref:uncharacterized protein LOC131072216 n=1 Tax=Cryptomeria japonica TaxID=3369 RepID=UPI0024148335|nr:uncharacterized protein LOC131072216 [Cryptomeria japonica]GLJ31074.1 hypothetical protein SUGI_0621980 [Cryptomeria japonica]
MRCGMEMADDLDVDPVRVGTRGTIGSLMYRELESMRRMDKINAGVRRAARNDAVSISCGRPLASLAGYRLSTRKQASQDSNSRPSFCEGSVTPRCSSVDAARMSASGKDNARRGFETPTCKTKLGFGRQESLGRQMDYSYKGLPRRKPVPFDGPGRMPVVCSEEEKAALRAESGGEFRTPMLPKEGDSGSGGARRSLERRAAAISSFVEVVDLSCNGNDKVWGSPIASRLRRLSFSRLSESVN